MSDIAGDDKHKIHRQQKLGVTYAILFISKQTAAAAGMQKVFQYSDGSSKQAIGKRKKERELR